MHTNMAILSGTAAADPELRTFDSGADMARILVTVRQDTPRRRVDILPVIWWEPDRDVLATIRRGAPVWITGTLQRRFWDDGTGRKSNVEIVATHVEVRAEEPAKV